MEKQFLYGKFNHYNATTIENTKYSRAIYTNPYTRRPAQLTEVLNMTKFSSSLKSANLKALRCYRHICRMLPFIIKTHEITHLVTPINSKVYAANWFRKNAKQTDLVKIDASIQYGYELIAEAQMHYSMAGHFYKFIMPIGKHNVLDRGINRYLQNRGKKVNSQSSKFLKGFLQGKKSHDV